METTDLKKVKQVATMMLYLDIKKTEFDMFLIHPFLNNRYIMLTKDDTDLIDILESEENYQKAVDHYQELINKADNLWRIIMIMHKPYRALFFKLIHEYLSEEDYNDILNHVWIDSENPNQDPNVNIDEWIKFFKKANKKILMSETDLEVYDNIKDDELMTIYRGVGKGRKVRGLSWTRNIETATWFAERWHNPYPYILKGQCYKKDVLAYFNDRGEDELVVNVKNILNIERINLYGKDKKTEDNREITVH